MTPRNLLVTTLCGTLFAAVLWAALITVQMGVPTESSLWIHQVLYYKRQRAQGMPHPKIVIASGSNALYGIQAELLACQTGMPAVNLAVHAGLGLRFILHTVEQTARPGDVVILPLEYALYNTSSKADEVLVDYILSRDTGYLRKLSVLERCNFLLTASFKRILTGVRLRLFAAHAPPERDLTGSLNAWGDETHNQAANLSPGNTTALSRKPVARQLLEGLDPHTRSFVILEQFLAWCSARRITVVAAYPSLLRRKDCLAPKALATAQRIRKFWTDHGIVMLGSYESSLYDAAMFYDTEYHLNNSGAVMHTREILAKLRQALPTITDGADNPCAR